MTTVVKASNDIKIIIGIRSLLFPIRLFVIKHPIIINFNYGTFVCFLLNKFES